jgi:hypothetical protein
MTGRQALTKHMPREADRRLDGLACAVCGREHGPMVPAGYGPVGQLFVHPECVEELAECEWEAWRRVRDADDVALRAEFDGSDAA